MADAYFTILSPGMIAALVAGGADAFMKGLMGFHFILRLAEAVGVGYLAFMLVGYSPIEISSPYIFYSLVAVITYFFFNNAVTSPALDAIDGMVNSFLITFKADVK